MIVAVVAVGVVVAVAVGIVFGNIPRPNPQEPYLVCMGIGIFLSFSVHCFDLPETIKKKPRTE